MGDGTAVGVEPRLMRRALAFTAVVAAAVVVGLAVGVLARGEGEEPLGAEAALTQDPLSVTAQVEPEGHFFGEPIVARVEVMLDTTNIDPARVRPEVEFTPYAADGPPSVERVDSGRRTRLTFLYPLRCLAEGCDPSAARGVVDFPDGRVSYSYTGDTRRLGEMIDWTPFLVTGRVGENAVREIQWRATESSLATVTYRAEPRTTAIVLLALAIGLAGAAGAIAWFAWGRRRADESGSEAATQTHLALVLAAARAAAGNGDVPMRRRALESVARELGRIGLVELATDAHRLAWSPDEASRDEVEELARRTELAVEGAR